MKNWSVSLALLAAAACGGATVAPGDVPGFYRMEGGKADDVLVLCADSTWINQHRIADQEPVVSRGSWELRPTSYGDTNLLLQGFPAKWMGDLADRDPRREAIVEPNGYSAMVLGRGSGRVRLTVDVESGRAYVQDPSAAANAEAASVCSARS